MSKPLPTLRDFFHVILFSRDAAMRPLSYFGHLFSKAEADELCTLYNDSPDLIWPEYYVAVTVAESFSRGLELGLPNIADFASDGPFLRDPAKYR
jgi:hypothetical protein